MQPRRRGIVLVTFSEIFFTYRYSINVTNIIVRLICNYILLSNYYNILFVIEIWIRKIGKYNYNYYYYYYLIRSLLVLYCSLGDCEVCGNDVAKYCCPRCEVKTCSLSCVNIHKKELECDGKKYKTAFKKLENFNDNDMSQGIVNNFLINLWYVLVDFYFFSCNFILTVDYRIMNEFIEAVGEFKMKTRRLCNFAPVSLN